MENTTRTRMVEAGLRLFRRQGYAETSWRELVKEGGTPWGSVHHFFPGGKEELATEALALFGVQFRDFLESISTQHPRPADRIRAWFEYMASDTVEPGYSSGCPVAGIALNSVPMVAPLTALCQNSFSQWTDLVAQKIITDRIDAAAAKVLATRIMISFEGALVLARVQQSPESFRIAGEWLAQMLEEAERA